MCKTDSFYISYRQGYVLRGIAMLMIIFAHCLNEYTMYNSVSSKIIMLPSWGEIGSGVFFFMSGYGLFSSMSKQSVLRYKYLYVHIVKLIVTFITAFLFALLVVSTSKSYDMTNSLEIGNILFLNMPDGTDMWFLKTILLFYILTFLCVKYAKSQIQSFVLICLAIILYIGVLYVAGTPGYWYFSNLCFATGVFANFCNGKRIRKEIKMSFVAIFVLFYISTILDIRKTPTQIVGYVVCCICFVLLLLKSNTERKIYSFWVYIGKNSLFYYLFSIPVILCITGYDLHWAAYCISVFILTSLVVVLYNAIVTCMRNKILYPQDG